MKSLNFCPEDCKHLDLTEVEQDRLREEKKPYSSSHTCLHFNKKVIHGGMPPLGHHPKLLRLKECINPDEE